MLLCFAGIRSYADQGRPEECSGPGQNVAFLRIINGVVGELKERGTALIRNEAEWKAIWKRLNLPIKPAMPAPSVDFSKQLVIGVFAGEKNGVLETEISRIERKEGCLLVSVAERRIPKNLPASQFEHFRPFHFVRLPLTMHRVVFKYTSKTP